MVIATDADGVLTDMSGFNFVYGKRFFGHEPTNPSGYTTAEIFGESKRREFLFGLRHFYDYCSRLSPRENAVEVCNELGKVYVITARKFSTQRTPLGALSRHLFRKWTEKNGFDFADIFYCSEVDTPPQKLSYCRQISADVMIEDNVKTALYLADNGIRVLLFDAPYNQGISHQNIVRVFSWEEIFELIKEFKK